MAVSRFKHSLAGIICTTAICAAVPLAPSSAAMFSIGPQNGFYGSIKCIDVQGNGVDPAGVPVTVYDCHGAGNQQFSWGGPNWQYEAAGAMPGTSIYTQGGHGCLDVQFASRAIGARVISHSCNGGANQEWNFINGQIIAYPNGPSTAMSTPKCLEAPNLDNGTQLIIAVCDINNDNQQFHIK